MLLREREKVRGWQTIKSLYGVCFYHLSVVPLQLQAYAMVCGNWCGCTATLSTIPNFPRGTSKDGWALLKRQVKKRHSQRKSQLCRKANLRRWSPCITPFFKVQVKLMFVVKHTSMSSDIFWTIIEPLMTVAAHRNSAFFMFYCSYLLCVQKVCTWSVHCFLSVNERLWCLWPCFSSNHMPQSFLICPQCTWCWKHIYFTSIILYISFWKTNSHNRILSMWFE